MTPKWTKESFRHQHDQVFGYTNREHYESMAAVSTERKQACSKHRSSRKVCTTPAPHKRHRPEKTLLYGIIDRYYSEFRAYMAEQGRSLPLHVQKEFDEYLKCGRLEHGFLRLQCSTCYYEQLVTFSYKRRGFCPSCGSRRMAESAPCWWTKSCRMKPYANGC